MTASGFDRIKPPERRLLERPDSRRPDAPEADRTGRAALFTTAAPRPGPSRGPTLVTVECSECGQRTALDLAGIVRHAIPLVVLAPWRSHPVFATCPREGRRTWMRVRLGGGGDW